MFFIVDRLHSGMFKFRACSETFLHAMVRAHILPLFHASKHNHTTRALSVMRTISSYIFILLFECGKVLRLSKNCLVSKAIDIESFSCKCERFIV